MASTTKFFLVAFAICVICVAPQRAAAGPLPPSYLVVDSQTGYVLIEQNAREKRQIASLTKMATACVVLDWAEKKGGDLNQLATISQAAFVGVEKNEVGWQVGDVVSLRDLLYAALVQSDNLAANALALRVGETLASAVPAESNSKITPATGFVAQMNALANKCTLSFEQQTICLALTESMASKPGRPLVPANASSYRQIAPPKSSRMAIAPPFFHVTSSS